MQHDFKAHPIPFHTRSRSVRVFIGRALWVILGSAGLAAILLTVASIVRGVVVAI